MIVSIDISSSDKQNAATGTNNANSKELDLNSFGSRNSNPQQQRSKMAHGVMPEIQEANGRDQSAKTGLERPRALPMP